MEYENEIDVNGLRFIIHPVFGQYAASECGKIVNIDRETILLGNPSNSNYLLCSVRARNTKKWKTVSLHRFVWECFNGPIPQGMVIDHINDDKIDNRLCNLQLLAIKFKRRALKGPTDVRTPRLKMSGLHYQPLFGI